MAASATLPKSPFRRTLQELIDSLRVVQHDASASDAQLIEIVESGCARLCALAIPPELKRSFGAIDVRFQQLTPAARRAATEPLIDDLVKRSQPEYSEALLERSLSFLSGVGPKRAESMAKRSLQCVADLLFRLPTRYDDRRALAQVQDLEVGLRATFMARVLDVELSSNRARGRYNQVLQVYVGDETGRISLKWFRGGASLKKRFTPGLWLLVTGDVKRFRFSKEIVHPDVQVIDADESKAGAGEGAAPLLPGGAPLGELDDESQLDSMRSVVPNYPVPDGINPRTLRRLIQDAVADYSDLLPGYLSARFVEDRKLPSAAVALRLVHTPELEADLARYGGFRSPAHERLVLEELYLLELGLVLRRSESARLPGIAIDVSGERVRACAHALPFVLTGAQERAWHQIRDDLARPHPMNRLLQGDVGSGKTAVALLAAVAVAEAGKQTALMAPTELLAEQHARTFEKLAVSSKRVLGLRIGLLTASLSSAQTRQVKEALAAGEIDLVVGTHALVQEGVVFADLALAIIDEQHRFGVLQRAALVEQTRGEAQPDVLVMTATPIPRTLALTTYGDLDVSVIDELPPGRSPSETLLLREGEGRRIMDLIRATLDRGEQVYVVYPLVEESEKVDLRSAIESAEKIASAFADARVEILHGRLDPVARNRTMDAFARGEVQILVATTVIEVGVDVANASLMIVEHADRFGLAQLHQLRGRVGRGSRAGTCVLVARARGKDSEARLSAMVRSNDGFEIADADLAIRGPGEFLGTRQSGELIDLRLADLVRDAHLVAVAREEAIAELQRNPQLQATPELRRAVEARWGERLDLVRVG